MTAVKCGYVAYSHYCQKSPKGEVSGSSAEVLRAAARRRGLDVDIDCELTYASMRHAVDSGDVDAVAGVWFIDQRVEQFLPSLPIYYDKVGAWVREDDPRRGDDISIFNRPECRIPVILGEASEKIAQEFFPRARKIPLTDDTPVAMLPHMVSCREADVALLDNYLAGRENTHLALPLVNVAPARPLRVAPLCFLFHKTNFALRDEIDLGLEAMIEDGSLDGIFQSYGVDPSEGVTHFDVGGLSF